MSRVRSKDTKPELTVRRLIHGLGYRYRLHRSDVPGRPDLVFMNKKKAIFVHGCFWHRHPGCPNTRMPKSRVEFWRTKLEGNAKRDAENQKELTKNGWKYLVIWECQTKGLDQLKKTVIDFMEDAS